MKNGRNTAGQFSAGNSGRPKGSRNKATLAIESLLQGQAEALTQTAVTKALEGDSVALRLCMDRIAPAPKDAAVNFYMPSMNNALDAAEAAGSVLKAVSEGELTPIGARSPASLVISSVWKPHMKHNCKLDDLDVLDASQLSGAIGIDVGFRRQGNTILIGTLMSDASNTAAQEITVPPQMISAMEHIIELQSELDDAATDLGKAITPLLKQNALPEDHEKYRMWSSVANRPAHVTLSFDQAYKFAIWLKHEPDVFPYEINEKVYTWWRAYSRKYREIHNRRKKQFAHRKHFYRETAAKIVAQEKLNVLEKLNKTDFAETRDKNTKLSKKARAQRFLASLSEFRDAIKNAADREGVPCIEVDPAYTSKTCSDCGFLNKALKAEKKWTCPSCGVVHDRDTNAANNLQKMGQIYVDDAKKTNNEVLE